MKGFLSLDQELRAVRRAKEQKGAPKSTRLSHPEETERPWQPDIDEVQQNMRELLRAVAGFSGVELPGLPSGLQDNGALLPSLDIKTLKDRFRNDLEGFSVKTTEELTRRAREQTHAAIDGVQDEVGGRIEQIAAEFRGNLQLPAQIEKLLAPCVEDAETRLERSVAQKFEQLVVQHEQLVQEKLEATLSSVHGQISALEQTVQEIRDLKAQSVAKSQAEPAIASVDVENLLAEHERSVQARLQAALNPVQAQISTLEQTVYEFRDLKAEAVAQPPAERLSTEEISGRIDELAAEFREKLQGQGQIEKLLEPRLEEAAARLEKSICQKVEHLVAQHEQLVQEKLQGTLISFQTQISALEKTVRQFRELKAESVAKLPSEQPVLAAAYATKKDESSLNTGLKGFLDQAFSRIELSFNDLPESLRVPPSQGSVAGAGEQHNPTPFQDLDREARIQQALDYLGQLGSKDPYPAS
jgi:hypothetical protein